MEVYCFPCVSHGLNPTVFKKSTLPELMYLGCCFLNADVNQILSKKKTRDLTEIRHMIMAYLSNSRGVRLTEIAKIFNRDHTTVIHGKKVVSNLCAIDRSFREQYNSLTKYLDSFL